MFTISEIDEVLSAVGADNPNPRSIFSYRKNKLSYKLSRIDDNGKRGAAVELFAKKIFERQNKKVVHIGGRHPFDMMVGRCRVEIKSSLATASVVGGQVRYSYQFHNIKPENFDIIVFAFISPEGLQMRQMSRAKLQKYLVGSRRYNSGYVLSIGRTIRSSIGKLVAA